MVSPCRAGTGSRAALGEGTVTQILSHPPWPSTAKGQREPRQAEGTHWQAREGTEFTCVRNFVAGAATPPKPQLFCCPNSELGCAFHSPSSELSQQSSAPRPGAPGSAVPALQPAWMRKAAGLGPVSWGEEAQRACGACFDARSPQGTSSRRAGNTVYASLLKARSTRAVQWPYPAGEEGAF